MDLLYTTHYKQTGKSQGLSAANNFLSFQKSSSALSLINVSSRNVVAFTTFNNILDASSSTNCGHYCFVVDANQPWFPYKIISNNYPISVLEWDITGKYLLVGDTAGSVKVFVQKDLLISEWTQLYKVEFSGEHIIRAVFFHNGRKINYNYDKKDIISYMDKFPRANFAPSVRQFGGVPADGVLIVTATGMIGTFVIPHEPQTSSAAVSATNSPPKSSPYFVLPTSTESLGVTRNFYTTADIAYTKGGHFLVAITNGLMNATSSVVQCFQVSVKLTNGMSEPPVISSKTLPSFFLIEGNGRDLPDMSVMKLTWSSQEEPESLVVAANCTSGTFIETWSLIEKATPIHKIFQTAKGDEVFKSFTWVNQQQFRYSSKAINVCISKTKLCQASYLYVAMQDNSVQCLLKDSLKRVSNLNLSLGWRHDTNDLSSKQMKLSVTLAAIDISWMGHLLFAVDNQGQISAIKVMALSPNSPASHMDQQQLLGGHYSVVQIVNLLEYCMVTGFDCLDILLAATKINNFDMIVERISDNFNRQQMSVFQQYYYVNFLTLKANLFRFSLSGQGKAHDLTSLLMLHSILIAFKSLLRPSDLTSHDKGPAENLAMVLSESNTDVDKVLLNLEGKDFTVEKSTLQSLQQLIQWVADLTLNILAKLPENRANPSKNSGYDISKDIVALNSIRELLVMIRIWGLLNKKCLPVFSRFSENLDILPTVFRLLSRLALNPNEPDDLLLDECCMLPSQVTIPSIQSISARTAVSSPLLNQLSHPIYLEYNVEPECLKFSPDLSGNEHGTLVDSIRHLQLGKKPSQLRKCVRCGAWSCFGSIAKTNAMKAWEQRWTNECRCGGNWRLQNTV